MSNKDKNIKEVGLSELSPAPKSFYDRSIDKGENSSAGLTFSLFFHDPYTWKIIRNVIIQDLHSKNSAKILYFGCGAGESIFSLGILLSEAKMTYSADFRVIEPNVRNLQKIKSKTFPLSHLSLIQKNYSLSGGYETVDKYVIENHIQDSFSFRDIFPIQLFKNSEVLSENDENDFIVVKRDFFSDGDLAAQIINENIIKRCKRFGYVFMENGSTLLENNSDFVNIPNTRLYKKIN